MKAQIVVYTIPGCPYCRRAKDLFKAKGVSFTEIDVENDDGAWEKLVAQTKCETVPQIFINDTFIGGCDDLLKLLQLKKLDALLE